MESGGDARTVGELLVPPVCDTRRLECDTQQQPAGRASRAVSRSQAAGSDPRGCSGAPGWWGGKKPAHPRRGTRWGGSVDIPKHVGSYGASSFEKSTVVNPPRHRSGERVALPPWAWKNIVFTPPDCPVTVLTVRSRLTQSRSSWDTFCKTR